MSSALTESQTCAAALAELPGMTPRLLARVLATVPPDECWQMVCRGKSTGKRSQRISGELLRAWRKRAEKIELSMIASRYEAAGIDVVTAYDSLPERLMEDHARPAVLFTRGRLSLLDEPTVAIVGTRRCSHEGRMIARRLGNELCDAGVCVVSGLALGIDAAAHDGALGARNPMVAGVVGSGLDVVYPKRHRRLWDQVGAEGVLVSEAPLGAVPDAWRFPARNRIIAGLADAVVVVESGESGGSLITASEADDRNVPVMAVPGSLLNRASVGTNALLCGLSAAWVLDTDDILGMIGRRSRLFPVADSEANRGQGAPVAAESERKLLDLMTSQPSSLEELALRSASSPGDLAVQLARMEVKGLVESSGGFWQRLVV